MLIFWRMAWRGRFVRASTKDSTTGDARVQDAISGGGKFLWLGVADLTMSSFSTGPFQLGRTGMQVGADSDPP